MKVLLGELTRFVKLRSLVQQARHIVRLKVGSLREMLDGRRRVPAEHFDEGRYDGVPLFGGIRDAIVVFDAREFAIQMKSSE